MRVEPGAGPWVRPGSDLRRTVALFWDVRRTRPAAWERARFCQHVESLRAQLQPATTPDALAASFAREAALLDTAGETDGAVSARLTRSPLAVAYVLRWLEVRDRVALPDWSELVAPAGPTPASPV